jgi:hypothetical protein
VPGLYVVFSVPPGKYWNSNLRQAVATAFWVHILYDGI